MRAFGFIVALCASGWAQGSLPLHLSDRVTLEVVALPGSQKLWFGRTPVTMLQFRTFIEETGYRTDAEDPRGNGPGRVGGHGWNAEHRRFEGWFPQYTWRYTGWPLTDEHPVSNVSWNDAEKFCAWLSAKMGRTVRLPTLQEWDRAARAGTSTAYFTGTIPQVWKGTPMSPTDLCGAPWGSPITLQEGSRLTMDTRLPLP